MNIKIVIVLLVSLLSFSIEARPKKKTIVQVQSFTPWSYTLDEFYAYRDTMDEALITSDYADGMQAPLPFRVIRGDLSDLEFQETLIFIVDNLAEAYHD